MSSMASLAQQYRCTDSARGTLGKQLLPALCLPRHDACLWLCGCSEIPDEDAKKPEGWLDEEPDEVDDAGEHTPGAGVQVNDGNVPPPSCWQHALAASQACGKACTTKGRAQPAALLSRGTWSGAWMLIMAHAFLCRGQEARGLG